MTRRTTTRGIATLLALSLFTVAQAVPAAPPVMIRTVTYNVLAPSWASPSYYPPMCVADLAPDRRRAAVIQNLQLFKEVDFFALQETQAGENELLAAGLGVGFNYYATYHDDTYWASWITQDPPFVRNGVAIAVNKAKYDNCSFRDVALGTGNRAAIATCRNKALNRSVRFTSTHLDSDYGGRRGKEAKALGDWYGASAGNVIDIIAGDFNSDTNSGVVQQRIINRGFTDVLRAVGIAENTHPYTVSYNANSNYGNIDHVVARGAGVVPHSGWVYSNGLWALYPPLNGNGEPNESLRICDNLYITGTDHFPVEGVVSVQP